MCVWEGRWSANLGYVLCVEVGGVGVVMTDYYLLGVCRW